MASIHASTHNEAMTYVFSNLERVPEGDYESVVFGIYGDFCTRNGIPFPTTTTLPTFPTDFKDLDLNTWIEGADASQGMKAASRGILEIVDRRLPYNEFASQIASFVEGAQRSLSGEEAATLEDMATVARQSHQLYIAPEGVTPFVQLAGEISGGNGGNGDVAYSVNWWKVLGCDIIGGLVSGPAGYLGASAISVIMQL